MHSSRLASLSAFLVLMLVSVVINAATPQPAAYVRASGTSLVIGPGDRRIFLRGVCFGNQVWGNPTLPPTTHHSEADFRLLRDNNLNTVRFYLNYGLFEDDAQPNVYKKTGFDWLDQNIAWAEKYDIYLILNMNIAQGTTPAGTDLWENPESRRRLAALWKAIADHCKDKTRVAAYDPG
jgi:endoglucanase